MQRSTLSCSRLILVLTVLFALLAASAASAAKVLYSVSATARRFTGSQLTLPIGGPAAGNGFLAQQTGTAPFTVSISDAQLDRAAAPATDPLFLGGGNALQLRTSLAVQVPPRNVLATFKANGRSGPPVLSFCPGGTQPGQTVFNGTGAFNPNCSVPSSAPTGVGSANGVMRYSKTTNQFGGLGALAAQGTASLAVWLALPTTGGAPGQVAFAADVIDASGPGEPIDASPDVGVLDGLVVKQLFGYTPSGIITATGATIISASDVTQTAWGGPLTTGQMKISVTANQGPIPDIFTLTGSDTRDASGIGNITLVSGSISRTNLTGSSATRNVVSLTITPEPAKLASAGFALLALVGGHQLHRRRSR